MSSRRGPRTIFYEVSDHPELIVRATVKKTYRVLESFLSPNWTQVHRLIVRRKAKCEAFDDHYLGWKMKFIKASLSRAAGMADHAPTKDVEFEKKYPAVCEFMTLSRVDSKTTRKTSSISLFYEHGMWKGWFNDKETSQSFCVSSETFLGVLEAIESSLVSDDPGWRKRASSEETKKTKK